MRRALTTVLILLSTAAGAQSPSRLGYQGRLLRADGQAESGVVQMSFALHPALVGNNPLWTEDLSVALTDGFYAVTLGEAAALPESAFDGSELYLEVKVAGVPLAPRQKLSAVPYALSAGAARNVTGGVVNAASLNVGGRLVVGSNGQIDPGAGEVFATKDSLAPLATKASLEALAAPGQINGTSNPVHWTQLKGVPGGLADGEDDGGLTSVAVSAPLSGQGTSSAPISIAAASASAPGYLSASDFARFDAKLASVSASAPLSGQGTAAAPLTLAAASATTPGFLAASDFARFDAKADAAHEHPLASGTQTGLLTSSDWAAFDAKVGSVAAGTGINVSGTSRAPVVSLGQNLTLAGKTTFAGEVAFGSQATTGLRVEKADAAPVTCGAAQVGYLYFNVPAKSLMFCDGGKWLTLATSLPASCKEIKSNNSSATDGIYQISAGGTGSVSVYCDMTTDGGGWTLVAYCGAPPGSQNFFDLKCGGGTYDGSTRTGCASLPSVALARASTEMLFSRSDSNNQTGNASAYTVAYKVSIPDPGNVNFVNHSQYGPFTGTTTADRGPCVGTPLTTIKGPAYSGTRYFYKYSLGISWTDSYPTGYGVSTNSSCTSAANFSDGPFFTSVHSGSGHPTSPGSFTNACLTNGKPSYNYREWYDPSGVNKLGSAAIWLK